MKKQIIALAAMAVIIAGNVQATIIQFVVETDQVYLPGGTNLNRSNLNDAGLQVTVYGSTVSSLAALTTEVNQFFASSDDAVAAFESLIASSVFAGPVDGDAWNPINVSPGIGPSGAYDWSGDIENLVPGRFPVMMISTNPLGSLSSDDFVGLVYSSYDVLALGKAVIGFDSGSVGARWNTIMIGESGSLVLAPIPEPATVTLFSGLLIMALVLYRRRK